MRRHLFLALILGLTFLALLGGCGGAGGDGGDIVPAPTGVSASDGTFAETIRVTWAEAADATGYDVYRAPSLDGTYDKLNDAPISSTSYDDCDAALLHDAIYWYKVRARKGTGQSVFSEADSGSIPGLGFACDFNGFTTANPWTPPAGWWSNISGDWAIVNPGSGGKGLRYVGNAQTFITCPYNNTFAGNDYTVTVKVRLTSSTAGNFGICARYSDTVNCYGLALWEDSTSGKTILDIKKFDNWTDYQMASVVYRDSYLNNATYYTLTLQVSGANPVQVHGSVTDGVNTRSVDFADDGSDHGAPHAAGKTGVYVYCGGEVNVPVIFDDLSVTVP